MMNAKYASNEICDVVYFTDSDGKFHHDGDLPAYTLTAKPNSRLPFSGYEKWYKHGILHRVGGPSCIYSDGSQEWHFEGYRHRADGPAVIFPNGTTEYWFRGKYIGSHEEGKELLAQKVRRARPHRIFGA